MERLKKRPPDHNIVQQGETLRRPQPSPTRTPPGLLWNFKNSIRNQIITNEILSGICNKLKGLGRRMPITALGMVISLFALAGVPPLSGFWSKLMLFGSALDASTALWWAPWLAIAGVLNSALSLAYYGWITRKMYFEGFV